MRLSTFGAEKRVTSSSSMRSRTSRSHREKSISRDEVFHPAAVGDSRKLFPGRDDFHPLGGGHRPLALGVELPDGVDLVVPQLDAKGQVGVGRKDVDDAAALAEGPGRLHDGFVAVAQADPLDQQVVARRTRWPTSRVLQSGPSPSTPAMTRRGKVGRIAALIDTTTTGGICPGVNGGLRKPGPPGRPNAGCWCWRPPPAARRAALPARATGTPAHRRPSRSAGDRGDAGRPRPGGLSPASAIGAGSTGRRRRPGRRPCRTDTLGGGPPVLMPCACRWNTEWLFSRETRPSKGMSFRTVPGQSYCGPGFSPRPTRLTQLRQPYEAILLDMTG